MNIDLRALVKLRSTPLASVRLVWLPYAGGSAAVFQQISNAMPETIEPFAFEYPGRGRRRAEPLQYDMMRISQEVAGACAQLSDRPYVLFGHSMGARVGLEACRILQRINATPPALLIVSGHGPPHLPDPSPDLHNLPDKEFIEELVTLGGTPAEILNEPGLMELALPILRADFTVCERHVTAATPRLTVDLAVYSGDDDADVSLEKLPRWADMTLGSTSSRIYPGGHFYIFENKAAIVRNVVMDITKAINN